MMQVVWECTELALLNKSEADKLEKAIWDIAAHIRSVWIQKGTLLGDCTSFSFKASI